MLAVERNLDAIVADKRGDEVPLVELMRAIAGEKNARDPLRLCERNDQLVSGGLPALAEFSINRQRRRVGVGEVLDLACIPARLPAIRSERDIAGNIAS